MVEPVSGEATAPASVPFWARCPGCGHCWAVAYYPLQLSLFARIVRGHAACPKCGTGGVVAQQKDGVLEERAIGATANQGGDHVAGT